MVLVDKLYHTYPNPFNATTILKYEMGSEGPMNIKVFDLRGKEISILYNGINTPGQHEIRWDGRDTRGRKVSSGVYLLKVTVDRYTKTVKVLMLK